MSCLQPKERTAFTDEQERKRELAAERQREQAEKMKRVRGCAGLLGRGRGGAGRQATCKGSAPAALPPTTAVPPLPLHHRPGCTSLPQAYDDLLANRGKAEDMREQQLLRSQMELAYKTGDQAKARKLAALLEPVDIADIGKNKRPPAQGT